VLRNVADAAVLGNQIRGVGADAPSALARVGVLVTGAETLRIGSNLILEVGADEFGGLGAGVLTGGFLERTDIYDNTIRRARGADVPRSGSAWTAIGILASGRMVASDDEEQRPNEFSAAAAHPPGDEDDGASELRRVLHFAAAAIFAEGATHSYSVFAAAGRISVGGLGGASVGVRGNVADGFGLGGAIFVLAATCVLGENRVTYDNPRGSVAAVRLRADSVIVDANHVVTRRKRPAITIAAVSKVTVIGNVTTSPIELNGGPLPTPWDVLNV